MFQLVTFIVFFCLDNPHKEFSIKRMVTKRLKLLDTNELPCNVVLFGELKILNMCKS